MPKSSKRPVKEPSEMFKVFRDAVCQISLEIRPDEFIGVKHRRVFGEVKRRDSRIFSKELMDALGSMERVPVSEFEKVR